MSQISAVYPGPPPGVELTPCSYVDTAGLLAGDPQEREHVYLSTSDGAYTVGVWEAQPYSEQITGYPCHEFCTVIRGSVTLTTNGGQPQTFRAGDSFTIGAGWGGTWTVDEPLLKLFAASIPS